MKCCPNRRLCWKCPIAISAGRVGRYVMATVRNDPMIINLAHKTRHHMGHKRKEETAQRDTEHAAKTALALQGSVMELAPSRERQHLPSGWRKRHYIGN